MTGAERTRRWRIQHAYKSRQVQSEIAARVRFRKSLERAIQESKP
jgi:hypothetical protein